MSKTRANIKTDIAIKISGTIDDTTLSKLINMAASDVLEDVDTLSTRREVEMSSRLFDNVYEYPAPTDLKEAKVIDVMLMNGKRTRFDNWEFVSPEEFDRYKSDGRFIDDEYLINRHVPTDRNMISISSNMLGRTLLLSSLLGEDGTIIDPINNASEWREFGDGDNLMTDVNNYVNLGASINFDISNAGGTTAGIYKDDLSKFDVSDLLNDGVEFVWAYITDTTDITNYKIRIGSGASDYYEMTATAKNDGTAFSNGWNLIRFDWSGATESGSVTDDECSYVAIFMTKDSGKVSEANYRFNYLFGGVGSRIKISYYSNYPWKSATGTFLGESTEDTDIIQASDAEYSIFIHKLCEVCEEYLRNFETAGYWTKKYVEAKGDYLLRNPSQTLSSMSTYWDFNNYDY